MCGLSPKSSSCHMTTDQAQEMRDSAQQIIDKYSKELSASLRRAGVTSGTHVIGSFSMSGVSRKQSRSLVLCAGAVNSSSASPSWSSALQEECSLHDGDAAERRSSSQSSAEPSGDLTSSAL